MPVITDDDLREVLAVGATVSDETLTQVCEAAEGAILPYLRADDPEGQPIDYADVPVVKECVLAAAVALWQTRTAPSGTYSAVDFTPSPFQLGRLFLDRFEGPLAPWLNVRGFLG